MVTPLPVPGVAGDATSSAAARPRGPGRAFRATMRDRPGSRRHRRPTGEPCGRRTPAHRRGPVATSAAGPAPRAAGRGSREEDLDDGGGAADQRRRCRYGGRHDLPGGKGAVA